MTCDEARPMLGAFYDNEIFDVELSQRIQAHVETCGACTRELETLSHVAEALHAAPSRFTAPADLAARVQKATGTVPLAVSSNPTRLVWRALWPIMAATVVVILFQWFLNRPPHLVEDALVADHVRSLQADHLFDVPSSDHHTVKPWFQGRIDFSPAVPDLATQGFPLLGGRLDYLDGQPAAALVYGRAKHVINVLVTHHTKAGTPEGVEDRNGYHVIAWTSGGLDYWAVSDVNAADLQAFRAAFIANP